MTRKITAVLMVLFLATSFAMAEGKGKGRNHRGHQGGFLKSEKMQKELGLTKDQIGKIEKIEASYKDKSKKMGETIKPLQKELRDLLFAAKVDLTKVKAQLEKISKARTEHQFAAIQKRIEVEAVLTAAQKDKLRDIMKKRMEERKDKMKDRKKGDKKGK